MELAKVVPLALVLLGHAIQPRTPILATSIRVIGFALFGLNVSLEDLFSDVLVVVSIAAGALVTAYGFYYSKLKYGGVGLVLLADLFTVFMLFVFTSKNLIELVTFWLLTELLGFLLIAYDYMAKGDRSALTAATRYLLASMIPTDIALFILLALTGFEPSFEAPLKSISPQLADPLVLSMVILGFFSKAAVFPLHFWLPDAHSVAPSPASALLSGLMVKMGVYAVYLLSFYPINRDVAVYLMLFSGLLTSIYGAMQACMQWDIKRLLAYSTTSDTSLIVAVLALYIMSGDRLFLEASILYTAAHAVYKVFMFLDAGFIEAAVRERDIGRLGYISRVSPIETVALLMAILSMFGMPPSTGFLAKLFLFTAISKHLPSSWIYLAVLALASLKISLSVAYSATYLRTHIGGGKEPNTITVEERALRLQPITFAASLATFLPTLLVLLATYAGYVELKLMGKLGEHLVISATAFIAICALAYCFRCYRR